MHLSRRPFHFLIACIAILSTPWIARALFPGNGPAAEKPPVIEPWGDRDEKTFDHLHPPTDMPPIARNESAIAWARPWLGWTNGPIEGRWNPQAKILTMTTACPITLTGHSELQLPDNASASLRAHEMGHDRLNAAEWEQSATVLAAQAMRGFVGMQFVGTGDDNRAREKDAWTQAQAEVDRRMQGALAEIGHRMDALSERYDAFTNHGRSRIVNADDGVKAALRAVPVATQPTSRAVTRPAGQPRSK